MILRKEFNVDRDSAYRYVTEVLSIVVLLTVILKYSKAEVRSILKLWGSQHLVI
jgi:phage terminase large subunit